jgi:signal transduction histidine kinase
MPRNARTAPLDIAELEWPAWLPLSMAFLCAASALAGALQRGGWLPLLFAVAAAAPLWWDTLSTRPLPRIVTAAIMLGAAVPLLLTDPPENDLAAFVPVLVGVLAGATMMWRLGVAVVLATIGATAWLELARHDDDSGAVLWVFGILAAYAGGQAVQKTLLLLREARAREGETFQRIGSEERERIAREVHDVVAHSLSVTLLHVTGARRALEAGDAAEAVDALRDAEALGRAAMTDIRSVVGMLRSSGGELHAPPSAVDLADLVRSYADAGLDVRLETGVDADAVPPTVGLALYRLVQESLANAAKHAPQQTVLVRLVTEPDGLRVTIRNPMRGASIVRGRGAGLGLVGMRERVRLLGGTLDAGSRGDQWTVEALLPLTAGQPR